MDGPRLSGRLRSGQDWETGRAGVPTEDARGKGFEGSERTDGSAENGSNERRGPQGADRTAPTQDGGARGRGVICICPLVGWGRLVPPSRGTGLAAARPAAGARPPCNASGGRAGRAQSLGSGRRHRSAPSPPAPARVPPATMLDREGGWSVSFAGCGFLGVYHIGAATCLQERAPHVIRDARHIYGASAGALAGAVLVGGGSLGQRRGRGERGEGGGRERPGAASRARCGAGGRAGVAPGSGRGFRQAGLDRAGRAPILCFSSSLKRVPVGGIKSERAPWRREWCWRCPVRFAHLRSRRVGVPPVRAP